MKINDAYAPGVYVANEGRYNDMKYRRCGRSGILLPGLSMGLSLIHISEPTRPY